MQANSFGSSVGTKAFTMGQVACHQSSAVVVVVAAHFQACFALYWSTGPDTLSANLLFVLVYAVHMCTAFAALYHWLLSLSQHVAIPSVTYMSCRLWLWLGYASSWAQCFWGPVLLTLSKVALQNCKFLTVLQVCALCLLNNPFHAIEANVTHRYIDCRLADGWDDGSLTDHRIMTGSSYFPGAASVHLTFRR